MSARPTDQPQPRDGLRSEIWRYAALGLSLGYLAGVVEAVFVHRAGLPYIPFAGLAYSVLFGAGFLVLALVARLVRRDLVPFGLGIATVLFIGLEVGFYLNVRANPFEESSRRIGDIVVLAISVALGVAVYLLARRRSRKIKPRRKIAWIVLATLVGLAVYFGISARASQPGTNCILISVDALRADHLGTYGYPRNTSPNIDALAAKAKLWLKAYTQSPGTTGGHAAMLTGLYTLTNGAYLNGFPLDRKVETLAEIFAKNGYATAAFINNWYLSPALGFGQGFDCFVDGGKAAILNDASPQIFLRGLLIYQVIHRSLAPPGAPTDLDVVDTIRWIEWRRNHRFFVFLHILDPHSPYVPPRDLMGRMGGSGVELDPTYIESLHEKSLETALTPAEQATLVDRYDEEILSADRKIGKIIDALARLELLGKTLIIITADHGEVLADSVEKQFRHGTLDYACLHVPLVVRPPRKALAPERIERIARSIDILPTIVHVLNLKDDARRQGSSLFSSGRDLPGRTAAFATGDIEARDEYSVITDQWQYMIRGERLSLYNLSDIETDVTAQYPSVAESLQTLVENWITRAIDDAVVPYSIKGRSVTPGREALERLKALGYIQ